MRFDTLDPGASVTFSFAYILRKEDLLTALGVIDELTVLQPTDTVSGADAVFSVETKGITNSVTFFVSGGGSTVEVGFVTTPVIPDSLTGGGVFEITFNTIPFADGDSYSFKAVAEMATGKTLTTNKVASITNSGPPISLSIDPPGEALPACCVRHTLPPLPSPSRVCMLGGRAFVVFQAPQPRTRFPTKAS